MDKKFTKNMKRALRIKIISMGNAESGKVIHVIKSFVKVRR